MSDPVANSEIEDVLSSIRKLVSEEQRKTVDRGAQPLPRPLETFDNRVPAAPDKLVLTPALRVPAPVEEPDALPDDAPFIAAETAEQQSAEVIEPWRGAKSETSETDETPETGEAAILLTETDRVTDDTAEDFAEVADDSGEAETARAEPEASVEEEPEEAAIELGEVEPVDVEAARAELFEYELDTPEDTHRARRPIDAAPWQQPGATLFAAAKEREGLEDIEEDVEMAVEAEAIEVEDTIDEAPVSAVDDAPVAESAELTDAETRSADAAERVDDVLQTVEVRTERFVATAPTDTVAEDDGDTSDADREDGPETGEFEDAFVFTEERGKPEEATAEAEEAAVEVEEDAPEPAEDVQAAPEVDDEPKEQDTLELTEDADNVTEGDLDDASEVVAAPLDDLAEDYSEPEPEPEPEEEVAALTGVSSPVGFHAAPPAWLGDLDDDEHPGTTKAPEAEAEIADLSSKLDMLEATIGDAGTGYDPDEPGTDAYAGTTLKPMEWDSVEEPELRAESETAEAGDLSGEAVPVSSEVAEEDEEDAVLDEDMLRDLVAEIIREELQGALGERITRNVRKLVRREIHRALAAHDLE